jgi:acetylornithine deacetylase
MDPLTKLVSDLVAINSINPDLVPGSPGEAEIASFTADWLKYAGLEVYTHEPIPGRPNVVGVARGRGEGRSLMLNGHVDTVGAGGMPDPFQPRIENGRLYGRGAYDMKGGLAACMAAAAAAVRLNLKGDVILTAVMDEEFAGVGTLDILNHYRADAAIVAEFTELELVLAHRGFVWLEVETVGTAAHGSRPELGVDAIVKMGRVLVEIEQLDRRLRGTPSHKWLGSGSLHASLIEGGQELSSYPERCLLSVERRTIPGEEPEAVEAELQEILDKLAREDPTFRATVRRRLERPPLETPESENIIEVMKSAGIKVMGREPQLKGVPFWTDAASLWSAGIPSVLFGPSGAGAHSVEEWVDLESVAVCAEVFTETAREFCR